MPSMLSILDAISRSQRGGFGRWSGSIFASNVALPSAKILAGVGAGLAVGGAATAYVAGGAALEARYASKSWRGAQEAAQMSRMLSTMQVGPFGPLGRPYGMSSNYGNSAGMTLAMHYSRQGVGMRDPFFSMAGRFSESARILGG